MRCSWTLRLLPMIAVLAACSDTTTEPNENAAPTATLTVDASAGFVYVNLEGNTATEVSVADPATSTAWDLGFNATAVVLNNDTIGPGDVEGYCICQNANATDAQVMGFTAAGQLAAFEAVTAADIPSNSAAWSPYVFDSDRWYRYNLTGTDHQIWPTFNVYLIRSGGDVYKIQLINYYGPGGETRRISFRYARLNP